MIKDLLAAVQNRWKLELAIFGIVLALVALWTALTPKTYVAAASLLFDSQQPTVEQATVTQDDASMIGTQADIIKSDAVAARVVERENLAAAPEIVARWRASTGGRGDINAWLGHALLGGLSVEPKKGTRVLEVSYANADPAVAARLANAFVRTYIDERLRLQTDPAKTYARWFEDRTREVRQNLEEAQGRLAAFQRRSGIVDSGSLNAEATRLTDLSQMLTSAEASAADVGAQARVAGSGSVAVQNSAVIQGLRSQIATKTAEINQMRTIYGPNHPDMQAAQAELAALNGKLSQEVANANRSLQLESSAASTKAADLRGKLNGQRGRMLGLTNDRSQLEVLQRDVDSARAAYDAVTQRLGTIRLQSEVPSTNARQLDEARPPLWPASPNVQLRLLLGAVLAGLIAVGLIIAFELLQPRVRTEEGLVESVGIPVLASMNFRTPAIRSRLREEHV